MKSPTVVKWREWFHFMLSFHAFISCFHFLISFHHSKWFHGILKISWNHLLWWNEIKKWKHEMKSFPSFHHSRWFHGNFSKLVLPPGTKGTNNSNRYKNSKSSKITLFEQIGMYRGLENTRFCVRKSSEKDKIWRKMDLATAGTRTSNQPAKYQLSRQEL